MLEIIVCIVGGLYLFATGDSSSNTNDYKNNIQKTNKNDNSSNTYKYWDNSTTYEIDQYLKENNLYDTYGDYSRERKIERLVERSR